MTQVKVNRSEAIRTYLDSKRSASPKQIIEGLKSEKGIEVSLSLVNFVKYKYLKGTKKKQSAAKASGRSRSGVSRSESIRQYIAQNPNQGPRDIELGLKQRGIIVSRALINAVKYSKKRRISREAKRRFAPAVYSAARSIRPSALSVEQLLSVKAVADSIGGIDQLRQALEMLQQLQ